MNRGSGKKVVIVGAGPAGLTAAYCLSRAGIGSVVVEKDPIVGGISRTVNHNGYRFDIGGHRFFTKIKAVETMWKEVLGDDLLRRNRLSRIYYNNKYFYYPLRPLNALLGFGVLNSSLIALSYLYAAAFPSGSEETLEQWVCNRFGKRLYETFFKTYTEKVWGIPCTEIRAEWAAQRIKGLSLVSALKNAFSRNSENGKVIKSLIDSFDYPKLGPGMMWQAVAEEIRRKGAILKLDSEVVGIRWSGGGIEAIEVKRGQEVEVVSGTEFISSMPLREAMEKFKPKVPDEVLSGASKLKYRDFLTVALVVNKTDLFPDNWIYIHDPHVKVGRIQNFNNWSPHMVPYQDKTCLGMEYFCFEGDRLWTMDDEQLIELGKSELETLGLANSNDVEDGRVVRMPKAYPIYDSDYRESLQKVRKFLEGMRNFQSIGRNGMHRYNNQDHSMLTAMLAVENVLGAKHDLWKVNVEQEYHEETTAEEPEDTAMNQILAQVFSRLDKVGLAAAVGSVCGGLVLFATLFLVLKGGEVVGPNLQLLRHYFFGYSVTVQGALIGTGYSLFWGFLFGWLFAYLRNLSLSLYFHHIKRRVELRSFWDFMDHV